jgi:hypothetical protein
MILENIYTECPADSKNNYLAVGRAVWCESNNCAVLYVHESWVLTSREELKLQVLEKNTQEYVLTQEEWSEKFRTYKVKVKV